MPRTLPGVPDANGFVFYGPIGTGAIDLATAIKLSSQQAYDAAYSPVAGGPLLTDPAVHRLDSRLTPPPDPCHVAPALDAVTPPHEARIAGNALAPAVPDPGRSAGSEAARVLNSFRSLQR